MQLETNEQLQQKSWHESITQLDKFYDHFDPTVRTEQLRELLKYLQRKRHLLLWHDHATLAGCGYLLITVSVDYDPAVFLSLQRNQGKTSLTCSNA